LFTKSKYLFIYCPILLRMYPPFNSPIPIFKGAQNGRAPIKIEVPMMRNLRSWASLKFISLIYFIFYYLLRVFCIWGIVHWLESWIWGNFHFFIVIAWYYLYYSCWSSSYFAVDCEVSIIFCKSWLYSLTNYKSKQLESKPYLCIFRIFLHFVFVYPDELANKSILNKVFRCINY